VLSVLSREYKSTDSSKSKKCSEFSSSLAALPNDACDILVQVCEDNGRELVNAVTENDDDEHLSLLLYCRKARFVAKRRTRICEGDIWKELCSQE